MTMSRRLFLGGAGTLLSLPWLSSLSRDVKAADSSAPQRFLFYYVPNGFHLPKFVPSTAGTVWELTEILQPLAPLRSELNVLSGMQIVPELVTSAHHIHGGCSILTYTLPQLGPLLLDVSVDQLVARQIAGNTRLASLGLRVSGDTNPAACNDGIDCAYTDTISWAGPLAPLAPLTSVQVAFDQLFAGSDPTLSAQEAARRRTLQTSVLDVVLGQAQSLRPKLGSQDQLKLDEWFDSIRSVEQEIQRVPATTCALPDPIQAASFEEEVGAMGDLMALAFECDLTRVITFQLGRTGSDRNYSFLGVNGNHHAISHHENKQENFDMLTSINRWEIEQFSRLLQRLSSSKDADGASILHNSLVLLGTDVGDGNAHTQFEVPMLMAGQLGGRFQTGHHLKFDTQPRQASLYLTILQALGMDIESFGQGGTGALALPQA